MMAGIYIHIPFCRSKCFYCGFYSVASLSLKQSYLQALVQEMDIRQSYLGMSDISTLYFGGGTPSYLDDNDFETIFSRLRKYWNFQADIECSVEMNPEDVNEDKLQLLKSLGVNRITIGIQSFNDRILKQINRTHSALQAFEAVRLCQKSGFDNIGIDLIIGLPGSTISDLEYDLKIVEELNISHVSVYMLSIDSNSVFEILTRKGKLNLHSDDTLAEYYLYVSDFLKSIGYEHYEISNFAKDSRYSRHNTSYWQQIPYLGLGAAAHSYNGHSRQWNVSNLKKYIAGIDQGNMDVELELLSRKDRYNEYLMTNFRTMWGVDPLYLEVEFHDWWQGEQCRLEQYAERGLLESYNGRLRLSEKGWLLSDDIFSDLFI